MHRELRKGSEVRVGAAFLHGGGSPSRKGGGPPRTDGSPRRGKAEDLHGRTEVRVAERQRPSTGGRNPFAAPGMKRTRG
ncbi:hypothetical protein VN24_12310 [Paenibacillus beijingensis]|uniref:Uncharacterized protein n=1 Tax=Paenibacillus beijingensis TaxID=1126833 RepID=A0A0D5NJQ6_9BACL|nr:hypothetical protein VN24_12310 [Paenibacillus beijingensis]